MRIENCFKYTGWIRKNGISGVLADFGNFFFQNVMAANIIENFKNVEIFLLFQGGQKNFFFDLLEIEKTFENKKGVIFEFMFKPQF